MESITITESEYISVEYVPDRGVIYHTVHKPISGEPLREALSAGANYLAKNGVTKWLSDDRKNGPLSQEDGEWGREWNRRMLDDGWKYWAVVVPEAIHAAETLTPVIEELHGWGLRMAVFTNVQDAFTWLDSLD